MVVGRWLSFWEGNFSGAMLNFRELTYPLHSPTPTWVDDFPTFPFGGICDHSMEGKQFDTRVVGRYWVKAFWKMRCFQCGGTLPILGWSLSFETKRCWMSTPVFEWFCLTQSPLVASANNSHGGRWSCCLWRTVERTFAWPPRTTRKKGRKDEQSNATLFFYPGK